VESPGSISWNLELPLDGTSARPTHPHIRAHHTPPKPACPRSPHALEAHIALKPPMCLYGLNKHLDDLRSAACMPACIPPAPAPVQSPQSLKGLTCSEPAFSSRPALSLSPHSLKARAHSKPVLTQSPRSRGGHCCARPYSSRARTPSEPVLLHSSCSQHALSLDPHPPKARTLMGPILLQRPHSPQSRTITRGVRSQTSCPSKPHIRTRIVYVFNNDSSGFSVSRD
jgi:hypothetical protein